LVKETNQTGDGKEDPLFSDDDSDGAENDSEDEENTMDTKPKQASRGVALKN
jgi:hypothetical protein